MKHNFKKLIIWQDSMELSDLIYKYSDDLPQKERFNLIDQLNRCSVSIPSNIAEGSGKRTNLHFAEFLSTSLSSAFEAETQLLICKRRSYGNQILLDELLENVQRVQTKIIISERKF